jgi:1-deoxy-D-xylulose-5-phosphate reductoisomerase
MTYPERLPGRLKPLDLAKAKALEFYEPEFRRFPCLTLARDAARKGGTYPTVLNAADEVAVYAFLGGEIAFSSIPKVVEKTLSKHRGAARVTLDAILEADRWARAAAKEFLK